jgi:hypothetical protein
MHRNAPLLFALLAVAPLGVSGCGRSCGCPETGGQDARPQFVPPSYSATDVQTSLAQCDLPHGPVVTPATLGDKRALMIGAWIQCPPPSGTVFDPAMAFRSDGACRRLVSDGNGGLVPGDGAQDSGSYSFSVADDQPSSGNEGLTVFTGGGSLTRSNTSEGPAVLESSPSRLDVRSTDFDGGNIEVWLVRLPGG